jgi:hypothetical protein
MEPLSIHWKSKQVIPFKSPLKKGDSGGCVFPGLFPIPRFHEDEFREDKFTTPLAPFIKGDFYIHYLLIRINKMKIPIQLNYDH